MRRNKYDKRIRTLPVARCIDRKATKMTKNLNLWQICVKIYQSILQYNINS